MTFESTNSDLSKLCETIRRHRQLPRLILGIDGLSRSGKTTFTERLRQSLMREQIDVCVFHLDDHIVERKRRYDTGHEPWYEYYVLQWDVPYLRENLFAKLRVAEEIVLPFYNDVLDTHVTRTVVIPAGCVLIVEGVFLQRAEWRSFLDYCVYLDCPREMRFSRESKAAQADLAKFERRYWKAEDYYLQTIRPAEQASHLMPHTAMIAFQETNHYLDDQRDLTTFPSYDNLSGILIRPFVPSDQDAAKELILQGLGEHFGFIDVTKNPDLDDIRTQYVDRGNVFLVAVVGDSLVATGALVRETITTGRLVRISVAPQFRRSGLGSRIVRRLLKVAEKMEYDKVILETNKEWHEVIRFYEVLGFQRDGEENSLCDMSIRL